jgi:predicted PurR-regulated permease PerM
MTAPAGPPPEPPVTARTVFRWAVAGGLGLLCVAVGAVAVYTLRALLVQLAVALFIAISLDPVVRWMIARRVKRGQAVAVIMTLTLLVTAGLVWVFVTPLVQQASSLVSDFPGYLEDLRQRSPGLHKLEVRLLLEDRINRLARELPGKVAGEAVGFTRRFLGAVVQMLLIVVLTIYFMLDLPRLRRGLVRLFPKAHRPQVSEVVNLVVDKVGSYMIGNVLISLIAGVTAFAALQLLKVPFALPLAVLVAVTDLIPLIGATLGAAVCTIVAAATTDIWPNAALLVIFFVAYQQLENYLIAPRVLRNTVDIPSLAVLVAALVGGVVMGVVGALMAIPVAAVLRVVLTARLRARDEAEDAPAPPPVPPPLPPPASTDPSGGAGPAPRGTIS